jgi:hypothetical protein
LGNPTGTIHIATSGRCCRPDSNGRHVGLDFLDLLIEAGFEVIIYGRFWVITEPMADKDTTIRHLRQLLLPASAEKTREVLAKAGGAAAIPAPDSKPENGQEQTKARLSVGYRCPLMVRISLKREFRGE